MFCAYVFYMGESISVIFVAGNSVLISFYRPLPSTTSLLSFFYNKLTSANPIICHLPIFKKIYYGTRLYASASALLAIFIRAQPSS
jgi:hypothetical protein